MASEQEQKLKALQLTLDRLDKTYGEGIVMKLGDEPVEAVDVIPSGSLTLDLALGIQGYPRGRVVEIYGPESSGKTTFLPECVVYFAAVFIAFSVNPIIILIIFSCSSVSSFEIRLSCPDFIKV